MLEVIVVVAFLLTFPTQYLFAAAKFPEGDYQMPEFDPSRASAFDGLRLFPLYPARHL